MANTLCAEFIVRLFHSRTNAHLQHLMTKSYAAHKALNDYYDAVIPLADSFAETYQGVYGVISDYPTAYKFEAQAVPSLVALRKWIADNRREMTTQSNLQNIIDEVLALVDATLYKLKHLS